MISKALKTGESNCTSDGVEQIFPQHPELVPLRVLLGHWVVFNPTTARELVEIHARVHPWVERFYDSGS